MKIKKLISRFVPDFVKFRMHVRRQAKELRKVSLFMKVDCDTQNLRSANGVSLSDIFLSEEHNNNWNHARAGLEHFSFVDGRGGVNPGDRRALFFLIDEFKPASVLEIGTHIGASTIHIAAALDGIRKLTNKSVQLTTLDIRDVNSTIDKPWLEFSSKYSPAEMINKLHYGNFVKFVTSTSLDFLSNSSEKFDFIFLDGDHSSRSVYHEIPLALRQLNENGVILLHDYFPNGNPLWQDGRALQGPYLATKRFIEEGVDFVILPLGKLPWRTKLNSNITSLALLMKKS